MKKRKGLTLLEVILSIAILGIISLAFLSALSNHFGFLIKSNEIAQDEFLAQGLMEEELERIKEEIKNDDSLVYKSINIFPDLIDDGIDVKYLEVKSPVDDEFYYSYIPKMKIEELTVLKLQSVENKVLYKNTEVSNLSYAYLNDDFKLKGIFRNESAYKKFVYLNTVEWYASDTKFIMPIYNRSQLEEDSDYYPSWPDDYSLVKTGYIENYGNPHETKIDISLEYLGRHMILAVTPGAKSGKLGEQMTGDLPIFVSAVPKLENLLIHLDANFINPLGTDLNTNTNQIKKWLDLSTILENGLLDDFAFASNGYPTLEKTDTTDSFKGQYIKFQENERLGINKNIVEDKVWIFAIVRKQDPDTEPNILTNEENFFRMNTVDFNEDNSWFLIKGELNIGTDDFIIGDDGIEISEIVIYKGPLSEADSSDISEYFKSKYNLPIINE